jgi:hypothetical protein
MSYQTATNYAVDPCIFPTLTRDGAPGYQKTRFGHELISELRSFCQQKSVPLHNVVATAWTLVLREYSAAESIAFALQNASKIQSLLVQVTTETTTPLTRLIQNITDRKGQPEIDLQPLSKSLQSCINTGIWYRESDHETSKTAIENSAEPQNKFAENPLVSSPAMKIVARTKLLVVCNPTLRA